MVWLNIIQYIVICNIYSKILVYKLTGYCAATPRLRLDRTLELESQPETKTPRPLAGAGSCLQYYPVLPARLILGPWFRLDNQNFFNFTMIMAWWWWQPWPSTTGLWQPTEAAITVYQRAGGMTEETLAFIRSIFGWSPKAAERPWHCFGKLLWQKNFR